MSVTVPIEPPPGLYTVPPRMTLPSPAAPAADPGGFTIDLERAPQVIRDLTDARDQLIDLVQDALRLGKVDPGTDEVSRDAAQVLSAVAVGGEGSLVDALRAAVQRLDTLLGSIEAEMHAYRSADEDIRRGFDVDFS